MTEDINSNHGIEQFIGEKVGFWSGVIRKIKGQPTPASYEVEGLGGYRLSTGPSPVPQENLTIEARARVLQAMLPGELSDEQALNFVKTEDTEAGNY